jgi:lipoprotein-anchoring transpeptidase ErfK/SrfK
MRHATVLLTLLAVAATPAAALAQETPSPTAPIVVTQPPAPAPPPPQTSMALKLERVGGTRATVLVGAPVRIRGTVGAYVPNEVVTVRVTSNAHKVLAKRVAIQPVADGSGRFLLSYRPKRSGRLVVRAVHEPTAALGPLAAVAHSVDVLPRKVGPSSPRSAVRALQRRLARLGYVVGRRGLLDARTQRAVLAFRKVTGMPRTSEASSTVMRAIARDAGFFKIRRPEHGRHIEADLSRQVIALVDGGRVVRIYPVSSGKPSTPTVTGAFRVYSKTPGTNAKGMVYSAYFIGGYATHGYATVPIFAASHGCLRVPIPDAISLYNWIKIGTPVDVYP